ncbi:MAG: hypothetical protein Kow00121_24900 [Elainellaceae cyanobacterium]
MKPIRYGLQFLIALVAVLLIAGHPGYSSHASTAIAQVPESNTTANVDIELLLQQLHPANAPLCPANLEETIRPIITRSSLAGSHWGILVEPLSSDSSLYSYHSDDFLIPASNIKLFTTAAALQSPESQSLSANLTNLIQVINRDSDNYYADILLDRLGGPNMVKDALSPLGVDPDGYWQVDGSGLSRSNSAKPRTLVKLLKAMSAASGHDIFYDSLPIAGINGTLRDRFHNTLVEGRVHAKTGTLRGVKALSGYLDHDDYGTIVFSIVVNQPGQSGYVLSDAIDQIVIKLGQLSLCNGSV